MPGYYDQDFDPWVKGIRNIGTMIAQQPMMRAQAEQMRQNTALNSARIGTEGAQAEHYRAQTRKTDLESAGLEQDTSGRTQIAGALRRLASNPNDTEAMADVFEGTGKSFRHDPDGTAKGIGTLLGQLKTLGGDPTLGAQLTNPASVENARARIKSEETRGFTLQPGAGRYDANGKVIANQPSAASQRESSYEETTQTIPGKPAETVVETVTPPINRIFGKNTPGVYKTNTVPEVFEKTIKTRRKIADAIASEAPPEAPAAPQAGANATSAKLPEGQYLRRADGKVRVKNAQGVKGWAKVDPNNLPEGFTLSD